MRTHTPKADIRSRFSTREQAEHYRDRFRAGRHRRTHDREERALRAVLASLPDVDSVLDVGSGPGRFVPLLAAEGRSLTQVDASWDMLAVSRADHPAGQGGHIQADVLRLPIRDDFADLVLCHRLLNHLADGRQRLQAMRELARVAGKYVVVSCLNAPVWVHNLRTYLGRRGEPVVTLEMLIEDACQAGLEQLRVESIRSGLARGGFVIFMKPAPPEGEDAFEEECVLAGTE